MSVSILSAGPARGRVFVALSVPLLLTVFCPCSAEGLSADDPPVRELLGSVSGQEMLTTVRDLQDLGSRAFCIEQAHVAAAYIHNRFSELGMSVSYQNFTFNGYDSSNVVAVIPGKEPDAGTLLFGAHYDSENSHATNLSLVQSLPAPGADDDASGVAAVIELAEALRDIETRYTLKFVAFGAEELGYDDEGGLKGSSHFVALESAAGVAYERAVVLDMIGYPGSQGNHGVIITESSAEGFGRTASEAVDEWDLSLFMESIVRPTIRYSDHASFWSAGYPAVLVTEQLSELGHPINPFYHSSEDTASKLSGSQMENITRCLLAAALDIIGPPGESARTETIIVVAAIAVAGIAAVTITLHLRKRNGSE